MWKIIYAKETLEYLEKLDAAARGEITAALEQFHWYKVPLLSGIRVTSSFWPVRVGNYRVLCKVESRDTVTVIDISYEERPV